MCLSFVLGACASPVPARLFTEASPGQQAAAAAVRVFPAGRGPVTGVSHLGKVEGYFCKTTVIDVAGARARAVDELKYRALLQGANAITDVSCAVASSAEKCPECWVCVQCNGHAIDD